MSTAAATRRTLAPLAIVTVTAFLFALLLILVRPAALAIRRRWRLVTYLLVAGAGALTLDPVLKALVGRLRPLVAHPIAYGTGDSVNPRPAPIYCQQNRR